MVRRVRRHPGGIRGLAELIAQHGEALEYELICRGLRLDDLGTRRLTWRDLKVIVRNLPPGNALQRARDGETAQWTPDTYLLAVIGDLLQNANWQRGGDKHAPRPKPLPRPADLTHPKGRVTGTAGGVPIEVMRQRLGWK